MLVDDGFLRRADGSIYGRRDPAEAWKEGWRNVDSLPFPIFDGSGARLIGLGPDVYGLVDYDAGEYRVGIYWNVPDDDGGTCATFTDFPSCRAFVTRLAAAHAPELPDRPDR